MKNTNSATLALRLEEHRGENEPLLLVHGAALVSTYRIFKLQGPQAAKQLLPEHFNSSGSAKGPLPSVLQYRQGKHQKERFSLVFFFKQEIIQF